MSKNNVVKLTGRDTITDPLTELLRTGAEQLIYQAVEAELLELLAEHSERRTEDGTACVVRNGHLPARELQTGLGPVTVQIPKVRAKTGEPVTFHSALVPPYVRKTRSLEAALPWLYLKGISSGEMGEALKVLVGPEATGLWTCGCCTGEQECPYRVGPAHSGRGIQAGVWGTACCIVIDS